MVIVKQVQPVIDHRVRGLCVKEYPGHKKGCPNFNKKEGCPPQAPLFEDVYDLTKPIYAIINQFDFKAHTEKMRAAHPDWSKRQIDCCLYWQTTARNQLLVGIKDFLKEHKGEGLTIERCPEAMGVEITKTLAAVGVHLEWPPETVTYQVALAGTKKVD